MGNTHSISEETHNKWENFRMKAKAHLAKQRKRLRNEDPTHSHVTQPPTQREVLCENSSVDGLKFNKVLTEELYAALLGACELSYAASGLYRSNKTDIPKDDEDKTQATDVATMIKAGFKTYTSIKGYTGATNDTKDVTCITSLNEAQTVMLVAFHGSVTPTGSELFNSHGDWGSNFEVKPAKASKLKLKFMPDDVEVFEGYGVNFSSVQDDLNSHIKATLEGVVANSAADDRSVWLIVLGHSKGAGMATIAAPAIKEYLNSVGLSKVTVALITISSPRTLHGKKSQAWAHGVLGINNMLRINVNHDLVSMVPFDELTDYRHVGLHFLDVIDDVHERERQLYGLFATWRSKEYWASLHYINKYKTDGNGFAFDACTILPLSGMLKARIAASKHSDDSGIYST